MCRIRASLENLVDGDDDSSCHGIVTTPDGDDDCTHKHFGSGLDLTPSSGLNGSNKTIDTIKFEEKRAKSVSTTKVVADGFSSEQATSNSSEMKRLQAGDIDYKDAKAASAVRNRLEVDGVRTEENAAVMQVSTLIDLLIDDVSVMPQSSYPLCLMPASVTNAERSA